MERKVLAIIPARGGSKGIPGKNLVSLAGKPLLLWTLEAGQKAQCVTDVIVSSDDLAILAFAQSQGVKTVKRPIELAGDSIRTEPVLAHVLNVLGAASHEYDDILLLQATSPLRNARHINEAYCQYVESNSDALISVYEPAHHPLKSFLISNDGYLSGIVNNQFPFMPRQALPPAYFPNGAIYFVRRKNFCDTETLFQRNTGAYVMAAEDSLDIDNYSDLALAEVRLSRQNTGV